MLLEEAQSREEVEAVLAAGDEELEEDIGDRLDEARRQWARSGGGGEYLELEPDWILGVIQSSEFFAALREEVPCQGVPDEALKEALDGILVTTDRFNNPGFGIFTLYEVRGAAFKFPIEREISHFFDFDAIEHVEKIPVERLEDFVEDLGYGVEWEILDEDEDGTPRWASGHGEGEPSYLSAKEDDLEEWCRDALSAYMDTWVRAHPAEAIEAFLKELNPSTADALREVANPNDEDLMDMVHRFFTVPAEQGYIEEEIEAFVAPLRADTVPVERDTILTVSRDDLLRWGVTRGVMWEMAPWRLIRLTPADLRSEGRRMRHCVGDLNMRYLQALSGGGVEIWSLRDRADKPRFTLEVDPRFWQGQSPMRGEWIHQLKGKANRHPGYAQSGDTGLLKFPEEVVFWQHVLRELGADPTEVADLPFLPEGGMLPNRQSSRSFDRPYVRS